MNGSTKPCRLWSRQVVHWGVLVPYRCHLWSGVKQSTLLTTSIKDVEYNHEYSNMISTQQTYWIRRGADCCFQNIQYLMILVALQWQKLFFTASLLPLYPANNFMSFRWPTHCIQRPSRRLRTEIHPRLKDPLVQSLTDGNQHRPCLPFQWYQRWGWSSRTSLQHPEPWSSQEGWNHFFTLS